MFVSRQMGHSSPDITLRVHSHLCDRAAHAGKGAALDAVYAAGCVERPQRKVAAAFS